MTAREDTTSTQTRLHYATAVTSRHIKEEQTDFHICCGVAGQPSQQRLSSLPDISLTRQTSALESSDHLARDLYILMV